ncbi:hypothetical protein [Pelagibacterium sediminicola]|uniref:hypothetical protein n=1 Tax=Pelagibacterium sediminicola TaxID=2248761 RepID=UPI000E31FEBE|nr:hypothetical protein [Pelagibacterium sediminicola]
MSDAHELSRHGHVFRPGPFHRRRAYWLEGAALHWRIGADEGQAQLADMAFMRLNPPDDTGAPARCVLIEKTGRVHKLCDRYWPRWTKQERHSWGRLQRREATFRALTFTLARRLKKANPGTILESGAGRSEWIATCIVAALAIAIILGGAGLMIAQGRIYLAILAFMALAAIYLPMLWPVIRSGGPRPLDPATLHNANPPPSRVEW